ncbi:hypothetical protein ABK040_011896 [Willaertia magna]
MLSSGKSLPPPEPMFNNVPMVDDDEETAATSTYMASGSSFEMKTFHSMDLTYMKTSKNDEIKITYQNEFDPNQQDPFDLGNGKEKNVQVQGKIVEEKKKSMTDNFINFPYWTFLIILTEIGLFIGMCIAGGGIEDPTKNPMIGPKYNTIIQFGAKDNNLIKKNGTQVWRFIAFMFLNQSVIVLVFNLLWLVSSVRQIEQMWKTPRMAVIYLISGIGGGLLSSIFRFDLVTTGCTSCIVGILAASLAELLLNWDIIFNPIKPCVNILCQMLVFIVLGLIPFVDQFSHIGGIVCGFLTGIMVCERKQKTELEKKSVKYIIIFARIFALALLIAYFAMFFPIFYLLPNLQCGVACYWLNPTWEMYLGDD